MFDRTSQTKKGNILYCDINLTIPCDRIISTMASLEFTVLALV